MEYKLDCKVHIQTIQKISSEGEEKLETYRFFLLLHSIFKNKVIKDFQNKIEFLEEYTGYSKFKQKKFIPLLIKNEYAEISNNNLILKGKQYIPIKYGFINEKGNVTGKFISIPPNDIKDKNRVKTIILELATDKKIYTSINNFIENQELVTGLGQVKKTNRNYMGLLFKYQKLILKKTAENEIKPSLSLAEISKLFNLKTISGASLLLKRLEEQSYLHSTRVFVKVREIKKCELTKLHYQHSPDTIIGHFGDGKPFLLQETFKNISFDKKNYYEKNGTINFFTNLNKKRTPNKTVIIHKSNKELGISLSKTFFNKRYYNKNKGVKIEENNLLKSR